MRSQIGPAILTGAAVSTDGRAKSKFLSLPSAGPTDVGASTLRIVADKTHDVVVIADGHQNGVSFADHKKDAAL
jgi:hypothetical protein